MFKVAHKIKQCRMVLIKWSRVQDNNSALKIQKLKKELEELRGKKSQEHGRLWNNLKTQLGQDYKEEEVY